MEFVLYSVNAKIVGLYFEKSGNVRVHVVSSVMTFGYVQTTAIGVLRAR